MNDHGSGSSSANFATDWMAEHQLTGADFNAMVKPLCLGVSARAELAGLIYQASSAYWGRSRVDALYAGHGESLELLTNIAGSAAVIVQALDRIQPDFAAAIELERFGAPWPSATVKSLPLVRLAGELAGLATVARRLEVRIKARPAHRPEDTLLRNAVETLASWCDRHGVAIRTSRTRKSVHDPRLTGPGGELVMRFFARVDARVTPAALYRVVRKLRSQTRPGSGSCTDN